MRTLKIFIGSTTENLSKAKWIEELLLEIFQDSKQLKIDTIGWWENSSFPFGKSFYEALILLADSCDAAIILAGAEDLTNKRGVLEFQPRDNLIFELGLFAGKNGREESLLVTLGNTRLPSDLEGISKLELSDSEDSEKFKKRNRSKISAWLNQLVKNQSADKAIPIQFPKLYKAIADVIGEVQSLKKPFNSSTIDVLASNIFGQLTSSVDLRNDMATLLVDRIRDHLDEATSIFATDVLGPSAWISPNAYRYLAIQIKQYIKRNTSKNNLKLFVDKKLGEAIVNACRNAKSLTGIDQSLSLFDNPKDFYWEMKTPKLQFARILLWSREELMSQIGEAVIAIHQAFNVPLFYLEVDEKDGQRDCDYILFERGANRNAGYYNSKTFNFSPKPLVKGDNIPKLGSCRKHFYTLLSNENLLLAIDARHIFIHGVNRVQNDRDEG